MKSIQLKTLSLYLLSAMLMILYACSSQNESKKKAEQIEMKDYTAKEEVPTEEDAIAYAPLKTEKRNKSEEINAPNRNKPNDDGVKQILENPFVNTIQSPLSTFSIDVDNASYSNLRAYLSNRQNPPASEVRIEEMINYFDYNYPEPKGEHPFSLTTEIAACPWNSEHQLMHIGLQGKNLNYKDLKPSNLVFLVDASGSMVDANKLPLLKKSLRILLDELSNKDKIAIVAYAGAAGLVLPSTPANQKSKILNALDGLEAGGSTAGGEGIELAYSIAKENLITGGNNRVILATDGDFNVGVSNEEELVKLIEEKRKEDIYLTICGFGMGNYQDRKMEMISNAGNGNYFYIDNIQEAQKVFVKEMRANLFTIAKDVKIQIEFNASKVKAYRLIGYENRVLANEDFDNDLKDAGELGAGHSVTALYEVIPASSTEVVSNTNDIKYQQANVKTTAFAGNDIMNIKFRYKAPRSETSKLIEKTVSGTITNLNETSENYRFSAAVAAFGLLLKNSQYKGNFDFDKVINLAKNAKGKDAEGYRTEFIRLVETAKSINK